jgi:hypothetical protein
VRDRIKLAVTLVPFPVRVSEAAGVVLGQMRGDKGRAKVTVDVMVMTFAATYGGGLVYTSDVEDLTRIARYLPEVRVLGV